MKITSLQIERFGARSQLRLDGLSDQLNVVYGSNGSGKTTIIDFIQWILYGGVDGDNQRYFSSSSARLGGSLRLVDGHKRPHVIHRYYDTVLGEQVRVSEGNMPGPSAVDAKRMIGVTSEEYRHIFCFGFAQPPEVERLVDVASARDHAYVNNGHQTQSIRDLTARIQQLRSGDRATPWAEALPALYDRRRQIQADLARAERHDDDQLRQIQLECDELLGQITENRQQLDRVQSMLHRADAAIVDRQAREEAAIHQSDWDRQRREDRRLQEIADVDGQIRQWNDALDAIRQRQEHLRRIAPTSQLPPARAYPVRLADLDRWQSSLGHRIDDLEHDLRDWDWSDPNQGAHGHSTYLRGAVVSALQAIRDDVQSLAHEGEQHRSGAQHHERAREQDHLRRCETEFMSLIDLLNRHRQSLSDVPDCNPLATSELSWGTVPTDAARSCHSQANDPFASDRVSRDMRHDAPQAVAAPDAHTTHLQRRREHLEARSRELAERIEYDEKKRAHLQNGSRHLSEARYVDELRRSARETDEEIRRLEKRPEPLNEIDVLEAQLRRMRDNLDLPEVLGEAGAMLQQLSADAFQDIRRGHPTISVLDANGNERRCDELSPLARDQLYLSLSLAIVAAYRRRGIELPMVLNDLFINTGDDRSESMADVISEFATRGHQVILFTSHEHVMRRFAARQARLYTLRAQEGLERPHLSAPITTPTESLPTGTFLLDRVPVPTDRREPSRVAGHDAPRNVRGRDWVAQWDPPRRSESAVSDHDSSIRWTRHSLTEQSPLADVDELDRLCVQRLNDVGIRTVYHFIRSDSDVLQRHLAVYDVTAATLVRWQSEISLRCHVGLSANDAALLVDCGIDDPIELSYADVSHLHRRIEAFLDNADAREKYGSIARFEQPRLSRWIQAAVRYRARSATRRPDSPADQPQQCSSSARRAPTTVRLGRRSEAIEAPPEVVAPKNETLRFFLEASDPVVDAPSIGPKTAERFHAIGVTNVAELLEQDPADAARRIDYRRITADLIRTWQIQTALVCRIPNLRGHDAQLLVACDISGPDSLIKTEPDTLLSQVTRLLKTPEGKRILRNAKAPDLEEVTAWIRWAQHARELQSA